MVTGQLPFKGEIDQAVIYSILNEAPDQMSDSVKEIPDELEQIVNKSLSKSPDARYQCKDEILND